MIRKDSNINDIRVLGRRVVARTIALCVNGRIWALQKNLESIVVNLYVKIQQMSKLHSMRKKNKIWSLGKCNADPITLYRRILACVLVNSTQDMGSLD